MPIYMDRHEVPAEITPLHVAKMHQQDLKIQHLYGCRGMTYWCDSNRQMAFCLIEAPDRESINAMHKHAHVAEGLLVLLIYFDLLYMQIYKMMNKETDNNFILYLLWYIIKKLI
jgi:hypothetical protein